MWFWIVLCQHRIVLDCIILIMRVESSLYALFVRSSELIDKSKSCYFFIGI